MFKKVLLAVFGAFFLMSYNVYAVEQSVQFNHSTLLTGIATNGCSTFQARYLNPNTDTAISLDSLCFQLQNTDTWRQGQFVTLTFIIGNISDNNALDARLRDFRSINTGYLQNVDVRANNMGSSTSVIEITFYVSTTSYTSEFLQLYRTTTVGGVVTLQPNEEIIPVSVTVWDSASTAGGATDASVTYIHQQLDNIYWDLLRPIKLNTDTMNLTTAQIRDLLQSQGSALNDIADNTENVSDYVDEQRQAYQNMQNTDGLIDIGNQDQALGLVGSINTFLGSITNTVQGNCVLPGDMGNVDLGDLDLCDAPQEVRDTIGTVGGIVLAVIDILIAYHTIKYIISFIDWARRN